MAEKGLVRRNAAKYRRTMIRRNWELYLMFLPVFIYFVVYHYVPMYGIQIAFRKFSGAKGIWGSPWRGTYYFQRFFKGAFFGQIVGNTLLLSIYALIFGFPLPILLALMLNEVRSTAYKKTVQTVTYAPHFISTVVMCSMIILFLSPTSGFINKFRELLGGEAIYFMGSPKYFRTVYIISGLWQETGWGAIIYSAALTSIDPEQHEAAIIDGANRVQRIWYINIPGILPTAVILLIMRAGSIMSVGFEKAFLLANDLNISKAEIISTFVYKRGLLDHDYSMSTAVGLFNSVINLVLLLTVNTISRKIGETSLW